MTKKRGFLGFFAWLFVAMFFATGAFAASEIYLDCPVPDKNSVAVGFWDNVAEPNFGGEPLGFSGSANEAISVGFEPYVINPHRVTTSVETGITDGVGNCVAVIWYMSDHGMFYRFVQYSENAELYDHAPTLEPYSKIPFGWITTVPGYYLELPIYQEFLQESNETKAKIFAAIPYQSYNSQDSKYYPFRTNTLCTQGSYCASNNMDLWDWNGYATGEGTSVKGIEQCDGGWPSAPGATECDETGNYIQFDCVGNQNGSGRTGANADFVNGYSFSRMVDDNVHMVCQAGGWNNEGGDFGNPDGLQCILINPDTKEIIDAKGQGFCSIDRSGDDGNHYVMTWTGDANLYVKCRLATEEEDLSGGSKLHVGDIRCEYFDADNSESKLYKSYNISYDLNGGTANNPVNPKREISAVISQDATEWTVYYEPIGAQECYEPFSYDGNLNKCVAEHGGEYDLCNGANAKCDPFIPLLGPEEDGNKQLTFRCWHNMADTNNPESCLYDNLDVGSDAARGDEKYTFLEKVFGTSGYINVRALYDQYSWLCKAGTYYKGGDDVDTCTTCPAGSVCPEDTFCSTGAESIGISSCGGGYTSEAGATSCHPATYKVTLDKQGGTGGTDAYWYKYNSSETCYYFADAGLTKCIDDSNGQNITVPTRTGYTFGGYWTGKNGTGTQYVNASGLTINNLYKTTGDRTLYAKWQPNTIKVTLDSDGATSAGTTAYWYQYNTNNKCYYYSDAALNTCMGGTTTNQKINTLPSKNGYAFGGYYTGKNGTGKQYITAAGYATGSIVDSVSSDITLYAKWNLETYTITYDANGGTMPSSGVVTQYTVETDSFALPRPTHAKATFAGWRGDLPSAVIANDVIKKGSYGNLKLTARYTVDCEPGKYFNKETKSCTECSSGGWYCEGGSFDYSLNQDQGLRGCPEPDSSFMDERVTVVDDGENITGGPELVNPWMRKNWGTPTFEIVDQTVEDSRYGLSSIAQCQYALLYNVSMPKWKEDHGTTAEPQLFEIWQYDSNNHEYTAVVQSGWLSTIPGYYLKNPIKGSCTEEGFIKPRYGKQPYADMDICPAGSYCPGKGGNDEVYEAECGSPDDSDILTEFNRVTCPKGGTLEGLTAEDQCDGSFGYRICFYDSEHADGGIGGIAGFNPEKCTNKIIEKCDSCTQISGVCVVDSNKYDYAFDDDGNTYTICLIHDENNPNGVPGYRYNCDIDTQQVVNGPRCQYDLIYYTLTYNANGGAIPDLADVPTKWNVNDPLPTTPNATREGYRFLGWLTENDQTLDAGTQWTPNEYLGDDPNAQVISLTAQWEELITCLPGRYLPAGETECKICPAGYGCPTENVTYSQNKTQDQGMTQCTATTYSDGTTGFCARCANGSTSTTDGATACTPCPAGQTGSGTGTCGYYCSNKDETVASWKTPTWVTGNIVNDDCVIASCTELYELQSDGKKCIGRVFKATLDNDGATTAGTAAFWYRYKTSSVMYADADLSTPLGGVKYKITVPAKTNYVFGGYYTQKAGAGTQVVDAEGVIAKHTANTFGANTTLYAKWTPVTVDCAAGQYLPAAKTACASCPAGYRCPNATTYSFSETTDQGATKCNKGTFATGGAKSCTTCAEGSYNTDSGATNCTACPVGTTTVGNVRSACDGTCPNADLTTAWKKPHGWSFNNTVPTLCKSAACAAGAVLANERCYHLVRVTLDTQGGTAGIPAFYYAYQNYNDGGYYKDEKLTTEIAPADYVPTRTGYEFGGYYTEKNGAGDQIIMDIGDFMDEQMDKEWGPDSFTIYAAWTAKQIACAAGQYLPAGAEECKPCAAGNSCAGGTFTFSITADQGLTPCAAGSFSAAGAKTCTACDTGSYTNAAGATACVPCQDGKTTSGAGRTSCDASCTNATGAGTWKTPTLSNGVVSGLCVIDTCAAGYVKVGDACERVVTLTLDANGGSTPAVTKVYMISRGEDAYEGFFKDVALTQHVTCDDLKSERTGYSFVAWGELMYVSAAGSCEFDTNEFFKNEDDMTISATWRANEYTVTFNANNGTGGASTVTVVYDATMTKLTSLPTRTGYQFAGYYDAATGGTMYYGTDGTAARKWDKAANTTLYAQWVVEGEYTIGYELNGGTNAETNPGTYTVETETITLADPTRTGYTFGGWYSESTFATLVTQIAKGSTGNKMLYAKWTPIKYTIKYNATIGTGTVADTNCTYDEDCTIAANGFTNGTQEFTGWTLNPTQPVVQFQPDKVVRNLAKRDGAVLTMYARWVACTACVAGAGANCELTAPVGVCKYATSCRTGYDTPVNAGKYNPSCSVITYSITYNLDGGTNPADAKAQYTVETADYTLPTPTWDGHTFIGWYSDAAFKNPITKIAHGSTGHVTLYAKWGTVSYNIVYNLNGGTNPADAKQSYTAESDDYTLPTPTKNGYNFAGWYTEAGFTNRVTKIASGSTGNKAFWAKWTTIPYTITYNLNGGTNPAGAKTQYTIESDDYTLPVPSKKGYDFGGWFTNDAFTGTAVTKIARGSTGAKTFWAKFTAMKIYCNPGKYLVAGATVCDALCPAGSMCAGDAVTYTGAEQGRSVCPAGTFSQAGANTCTKCLSGAFSATDGATACTPCAAGTTNDGWGNTKCDIQCANGAHVAKWMESTWNVGTGSMGQVVAGECEIESCATGYLLGDNECVERITCVPGKYYDGTRLVPCPAGSYCPGGGETTPGVPSCATSCATVGDGSYNVSVPGASSTAGCTHKCDAYPIAGGVAKPVLEYAPYPTQCEFTGVSDTGNPCDIIDGRCVETRCNGNYEMINGRCEPCGRDFALSYNMTAGNCIVTKCEIGYHPVDDGCAENTRECTIPGASSAVQEWNEKTNSFGACIVTECDDGYHIASNKCVSDTQACTVANGTGTQEWNHVSNTWGACVATECAAGYTNEKTESAEPTRECGPCRNGYGVDGTRVASSYIRGCEIASCMYQGEMYNLENNECVPICSVAGYSDETGTMKWNPVTKKCDRTCADGYRMW